MQCAHITHAAYLSLPFTVAMGPGITRREKTDGFVVSHYRILVQEEFNSHLVQKLWFHKRGRRGGPFNGQVGRYFATFRTNLRISMSNPSARDRELPSRMADQIPRTRIMTGWVLTRMAFHAWAQQSPSLKRTTWRPIIVHFVRNATKPMHTSMSSAGKKRQ